MGLVRHLSLGRLWRRSLDEKSHTFHKMEQKKINPEIDVTKFVNITDTKFVFYINNQPREIEAHEEKMMPVYIARHGAKHLIDKILQEKHHLHDTFRDTPLRRSYLAQILPEEAKLADVKPLSPEEEQEEIKKELAKQAKMIDDLSGKTQEREEKEKSQAETIKKLEEQIASLLSEKLNTKGRSKK